MKRIKNALSFCCVLIIATMASSLTTGCSDNKKTAVVGKADTTGTSGKETSAESDVSGDGVSTTGEIDDSQAEGGATADADKETSGSAIQVTDQDSAPTQNQGETTDSKNQNGDRNGAEPGLGESDKIADVNKDPAPPESPPKPDREAAQNNGVQSETADPDDSIKGSSIVVVPNPDQSSGGTVPADPRGLHPKNIFSSSVDKAVYTGAQETERLNFTEAGRDEALSILKAQVDSQSAEHLQSSKDFAQIIHQVHIERKGQVVHVRLLKWKSATNNSADEYRLTGVFNADRVAVLNAAESCPFKDLQMELKCLDHGRGCETMRLKLSEKKANGRSLYGVFRSTPVHVFLEGKKSICTDNGPYARWQQIISNTMTWNQNRQSDRKPRLSTARLDSTSLIYGESRVDAALTVLRPDGCEELVYFNGPLVKEFGHSALNRRLTVVPTQLKVPAGHTSQYRGYFMGSVSDITLINNDGRGNLRLLIELRGEGRQPSEKFEFSLLRRHSSINASRLANTPL